MAKTKNTKISKSLKKYHYKKKFRKRHIMIKTFLIIYIIALSGIAVSAKAPYQPENNSLPIAGEREITMVEWVKIETEKAGLDWDEVYCLIKHESGWNDYAYNVNNNGTTDFGLWQINSIHKKTISVKERWDYKKATEWAINKRLHDGNWNAWYGYLYHCI